jgi:hypothetical protein
MSRMAIDLTSVNVTHAMYCLHCRSIGCRFYRLAQLIATYTLPADSTTRIRASPTGCATCSVPTDA